MSFDLYGSDIPALLYQFFYQSQMTFNSIQFYNSYTTQPQTVDDFPDNVHLFTNWWLSYVILLFARGKSSTRHLWQRVTLHRLPSMCKLVNVYREN